MVDGGWSMVEGEGVALKMTALICATIASCCCCCFPCWLLALVLGENFNVHPQQTIISERGTERDRERVRSYLLIAAHDVVGKERVCFSLVFRMKLA